MRKNLSLFTFLVVGFLGLPFSSAMAKDTAFRKLDILFVVDNSGSMSYVQSQFAQGIPSFLNTLESSSVKTAVTTTDAFYGDQFINDGCSICNVNQTKFRNDLQVGTNGSGDERAFSSIKAALNSPLNVGFHRPGAYLAIVIVSDADDFSHGSINLVDSYTQELFPVEQTVSFLSQFTNGKPKKDFSVSTIGVLNEECKQQLASENKIAFRYMALSDLTGGLKTSICSTLQTSLNEISQALLSSENSLN